MDQPTTETKLREYLKRVTTELGHTRQRLYEVETAGSEPIAIVGMACRLPGGVESPEDLWDLVIDERDAVAPFPSNRGWDVEATYHPDADHPGTTYIRQAALLDDVTSFDSGFFGINPREAFSMDPQQRLLLETSWEALERAHIDPARIAGERVGVFTGIVASDYLSRLREIPESIEGYISTGTLSSVASGRVSYTLGLTGPAVSVDTACSSSLTSLHLAVQALRGSECDMALSGGVSVTSSLLSFVDFSRQRGLSPDGRIKPFAAAADGTNWAEGAGVLVLERLSDARKRGHTVLAVIRGSAINQDGASNGLTAPNDLSQQAVITAALADARLTSADVDVVEAHGTGTVLGDPLEAKALLATYGNQRPADRPLQLGSVKSNLGHSAAAAGVTGVIKTVMAMRHGVLPKTLNIDEPTSHVDWSSGAISLLTEQTDWPSRDGVRRAAVSSFGVSGTNAHVVLEADADVPVSHAAGVTAAASTGPVPLVVSGRTPESMRANASRLSKHLPRTDESLADVAFSLVTTRPSWEHRGVVVARDRTAAVARLDTLASQGADTQVVNGIADINGRPVFVFPGQGSQWTGMAVELAETFPVFRSAMEECAQALRPFASWDLWEQLRGNLSRVDVVQPALWAVMISLARLWRSVGVEPAAVVGHSQGEVAAAVVAGALSLEDGARVVTLRSQLIGQRLAGKGGMVALDLPEAAVRDRIRPYGERVAIATTNSPSSTVVSGEPAALAELMSECAADETQAKRITVDYASHSSQVETIHDELIALLKDVTPREGTIPMYSTVCGESATDSVLDATYWYRNLRNSVRFDETVRTLLPRGAGFFVEVSPHPVLTPGIRETCDDVKSPALALGTLRRDDGGAARFMTSLAEGHVRGLAGVRWEALFANQDVRPVDLPTSSFQRQRFWLEDVAAQTQNLGGSAAEQRFWNAVQEETPECVAAELDTDADLPLRDALPALSAWRERVQTDAAIDGWRYRVRWRRVSDAAEPALTGRWLVLVPATDTVREWDSVAVTALENHGAEVERRTIDITDADRGRMAEIIRDATEDGPALRGIVSLLPIAEGTHAKHPTVRLGIAATTLLAQAAGDLNCTARLWTVTHGAVDVGDGNAPNPAAAMVWGLGRSIALEQPDQWGGLLDVAGTADGQAVERFAHALSDADDEDQVSIRPSGTYVRRLTADPLNEAAPTYRPRGTVLVTGGTGGIGTHLTEKLAADGAKHLLFVSRRGADSPGADALRQRLAAYGTEVTFAACDVSDREALATVLERIPPDRPLTAVFHAAGVLQAQLPVSELDLATCGEIVAAKVDGARHLDALLDETPLDAFVMFSSVASVWGSAGQAAYAAANTYLDALADRRQAHGRPATSLAWGTWPVGMADWPEARKYLRALGLPPMDLETAMAALNRSALGDASTVAIAPVEWAKFTPGFTAQRPTRFFDEIPQSVEALRAIASPEPEGLERDLRATLAELDTDARYELLLSTVQNHLAATLGFADPPQLKPEAQFRELGVDSLTGVDFRNRLVGSTGFALSNRTIFDYPTPESLAQHLYDLSADDSQGGVAASAPHQNSLVSLFLRSCVAGRYQEGNIACAAIAGLRDTFGPGEEPSVSPPVTLSEGADEPVLICVPSFSWFYDPHYYGQFATAFHTGRELTMLNLPGYADGEPLPDSATALAEALAAQTLRVARGRHFALLAHSAGGLIAADMASALARQDARPEAFVAIDTPVWNTDDEGMPSWSAPFVDWLYDMTLQRGGPPEDDAWTSARAHYTSLDYGPAPRDIPTLLVRATDLIAGLESGRDGWAVDWEAPHTEVTGPGDHFTVLSQHARTNAQMVEDWLRALPKNR